MSIEARYLDIEWNSARQVQRVSYGDHIAVEKTPKDSFLVETLTYPKVYFYFAFRFTTPLSTLPYLHLGEKREPLLEVKDPYNGETWWIPKGKWLKDKKKYSHESHRTAGRMELKADHLVIEILNRTNNFSVEELEYLLQDFKGELWSIILNADSVIGANRQNKVPNIFNDDVMQQVDLFIEAAQHILKEPKFFLTETQGLVSKKNVRPVLRTFRELSTKPHAKHLSSRLHRTSYDNAENRYVHFCIERLYTLFIKMLQVADKSSQQTSQRARYYHQAAERLRQQATMPKTISKRAFEAEFTELKNKVQILERNLQEVKTFPNPPRAAEDFIVQLNDACKQNFCFTSQENIRTYTFSLDPPHAGKGNTLFCNYLYGRDFRRDIGNGRDYQGRYLAVEYPEFVFRILRQHQGKSVTIAGTFEIHDSRNHTLIVCRKIKEIQIYIPGLITHEIFLNNRYGNSNNTFFCNIMDGINYKDNPAIYSGKKMQYLCIRYPDNLAPIIAFLIDHKCTLKITGKAERRAIHNQYKGNYYELMEWKNIHEIQIIKVLSPLYNSIQNYQHQLAHYEKNRWQAPYTRQEIAELNAEAAALTKRADFFEHSTQDYSKLGTEVAPRLHKLRQLKLGFKALRIKTSSYLPNSMTFVQNPHYSKLQSSFKNIINLSNINLDQLEQLLVIDNMGLVTISKIYELWILLQLIKILTREFGFIFEKGWEDNLIMSVRAGSYDVIFDSAMEHRQLKLTLTYEKTLSNKRRPDFVVDIESREDNLATKQEAQGTFQTRIKRLVLDAKFYDDATETKIRETLSELIKVKNYDEKEKNRVFIVHPATAETLDQPITSPLDWGESCDYGHKQSSPTLNHAQGHISVIPGNAAEQTLENLKRLLLLHLQDSTTVLYQKNSMGPYPDWHNYFCPNCSAHSSQLTALRKLTKGGGTRWEVKCKNCLAEFQENFCYRCKDNARLFKNGLKWTYHRTYAHQITNCKCPRCDADLLGLGHQ